MRQVRIAEAVQGNFLSTTLKERGGVTGALIGPGVLGLVGALRLWMLKRWALRLTVVVCVLNILAAAPEVGLCFGHCLASLGDYRCSRPHPYLGRIVLWKFADLYILVLFCHVG